MDIIINEKIQNAYNALYFQCAKTFPEGDLALIGKAFDFAFETLGNSVWANGEFVLFDSV